MRTFCKKHGIYLPSMVVNKLNFYSQELGITQSLLVLASIVLVSEIQ